MLLRRTTPLVLATLVLVAFALPAAAKPGGGNSGASAACENGGYRDYTRSDGTAFKNEGACVKYAAQGGTLTPVVTDPFTVSYIVRPDGFFAAVIGFTGLEPNTDLLVTETHGVISTTGGFSSGATGEGTITTGYWYQCTLGGPLTGFTLTGTLLGATSPESFEQELPAECLAP